MATSAITTPGHGKFAVASVPSTLDEPLTTTLVDVCRREVSTASLHYHAVSIGAKSDGTSDYLVGSIEDAIKFPYYRLAVITDQSDHTSAGADEIMVTYDVLRAAETELSDELTDDPLEDTVTPRIAAIAIRRMVASLNKTEGDVQTLIVVPDSLADALYDPDAAPQQSDGINAPNIARSFTGFAKPEARPTSEDITPFDANELAPPTLPAIKPLSDARLLISRSEAAFYGTLLQREDGSTSIKTEKLPDTTTMISVEERGNLFADEATVTIWSITKSNEGSKLPFDLVPLTTINANFEQITDDQFLNKVRQHVADEVGIDLTGTIISMRTANDGTPRPALDWSDDCYDREISQNIASSDPRCTAALAVLISTGNDTYDPVIRHFQKASDVEKIVEVPFDGQFTRGDQAVKGVDQTSNAEADKKLVKDDDVRNTVFDVTRFQEALLDEARRRELTGTEIEYLADDKTAKILPDCLRAVGVDPTSTDVDLQSSEILNQISEPLLEAIRNARSAEPGHADEAPKNDPASNKPEIDPEQISEKSSMANADIASAVTDAVAQGQADEELPIDPNEWKGRALAETVHLVNDELLSTTELDTALSAIDKILIAHARSDTANEEVAEHFLADLVEDLVLLSSEKTPTDTVTAFLSETAKLHPALFINSQDADYAKILAISTDWTTALFEYANGNGPDADTDTVSIKVHIMVAAMTRALQRESSSTKLLVDTIRESNTDIGKNKKKTPKNLFGVDELLPQSCGRWMELDVAHLLDAVSRRYSEAFDTYTDSGSLAQLDHDPNDYEKAVSRMNALWTTLAKNFKDEHGHDPKEHVTNFIQGTDKYTLFVESGTPFTSSPILQKNARLTATAVRADWRNHHARLVLEGADEPTEIDKTYIEAKATQDAKKRVLDEHIELAVWLAEHHPELVDPDVEQTTIEARGTNGPQGG